MLSPISLPDLDPIPRPTLIHVTIELEIDLSIFDSNILLMGKECEFQFFNLNPNLESKLALKPKLD